MDALGHELPSERVRIEKLPDAYEREFFPSKTPFTKTYSVRFIMPAPGGDFVGAKSGSLTLRFASPIGRIELALEELTLSLGPGYFLRGWRPGRPATGSRSSNVSIASRL